MVYKGVDKNYSDPLGERNICHTSPVTTRTEKIVRAMTYRSNNGDRKIPSVAKSGHDNSETEELGWGAAHDSNNIAESAANGRTNKHIDRDEPPFKGFFEGDGLAKLDKYEAREEKSKDKFAKEPKGGPRNNLDSWMAKYKTYDCEAQKFHQGHDST